MGCQTGCHTRTNKFIQISDVELVVERQFGHQPQAEFAPLVLGLEAEGDARSAGVPIPVTQLASPEDARPRSVQ